MSIQDFLLLFSFCLLAISLCYSIKSRNNAIKSKRLPPGPIRLPLIGNLYQLCGVPHVSMQSLSRKYGPIMFLQLGSIPTIVISSADIAREIFRNHDLVFSSRPALYAAKKLSYNLSDVSFAPYGKYWRDLRKIVMLDLLSTKKVQSFHAVRHEEVMQVLHTVARSSDPVDLSRLMLSLANDVICRVAFGKKYTNTRLYEVLRETQSLLGGFCIADFFPRLGWINKFNGLESSLERNFKELDVFYNRVIEEHRARERHTIEDEDLVDALLRLQKDSHEETPLTDEQIKAVLTDMFIAGTDTSSAVLVWTMAELIRNPSTMKKAQNEVREAVKGKTNADEGDLSRLVYMKSAIKETMRLHTPVPLLVPRETTENCTVSGYNIPAGARVFINATSISLDPKSWKNPNEFRPERFMDGLIDFKGQNYEFIPFGAGRRICPGINFGTLLIELALANLLLHFDWKMPEGAKIEDMNMDEAFGLTMHKKVPLCLVPIPVGR